MHGIIIDFTAPRGSVRSGTYLPEIASREGWSKQEAILSLVRKAGWSGPVGPDLLAGIRLTRYKSSKCHTAWADWAAARRPGGGGAAAAAPAAF